MLVLLGLLTLPSLAVDYLATVYGAKRLGATRRGVVGAMVHLLGGFFFSLPGILLGPFLGALVFEWTGRRPSGRVRGRGPG